MKNIVMSHSNLEDIANRLAGCQAVLDALVEVAGISAISGDALSGASDLLEMIRRDFQADIDCAEEYGPAAEVVA